MDGQEIGYCFSITHPGDEEYKPAVQQAQVTIPVKNTEGQQQHIKFATLPDIKRGTKYVLICCFQLWLAGRFLVVESGPLMWIGNRLILTSYYLLKPPNPVKVTVNSIGNTEKTLILR